MLTRKIELIVRREKTVHQQEVVQELLKAEKDLNWETVFRTLRKLAAEGTIRSLGGGYYRCGPPEDKNSERITKWF